MSAAAKTKAEGIINDNPVGELSFILPRHLPSPIYLPDPRPPSRGYPASPSPGAIRPPQTPPSAPLPAAPPNGLLTSLLSRLQQILLSILQSLQRTPDQIRGEILHH